MTAANVHDDGALRAAREYARLLRERIGNRYTIHAVARHTGFPFPYVRRVLKGADPHASREFNASVCQWLSLDIETMWRVLKREPPEGTTMGADFDGLLPPPDVAFIEVWPKLNGLDKTVLVRLAESLVSATRAG